MIIGKRIQLLNMEMSHIPLIYSAYLTGKYDRFFLTDYVTMDRIAELRGTVFIIVDKANTHQILGFCSYKVEDEPSRRFTLTVLLDEQYHNKKLGREAAVLLLWHVFNNLNFYKCKVTIRIDNEASIKGVSDLGFFQVGKLKDEYFMKGQFWDAKIFEITKRNFNEKYKDYLEGI